MVNEASPRTPGALQSIVLGHRGYNGPALFILCSSYLLHIYISMRALGGGLPAPQWPHNTITIHCPPISIHTNGPTNKYSYISVLSTQKHHQEMNIMHVQFSFFCYFAPLLTDKLSFPSDWSPLHMLAQVAGHWIINGDIVGNHGSPVKARCLWLRAGLLLSLVTKTVNTAMIAHNIATTTSHCLMSLSDVNGEVRGDTGGSV